jgi:transposase-like protein
VIEGERTGGLANITSLIIFGNQPGTNITGKSVSVLTAGANSQIPNCPSCGSAKTWRAGLRYLKDEVIQRWVCRNMQRHLGKEWREIIDQQNQNQYHYELLKRKIKKSSSSSWRIRAK